MSCQSSQEKETPHNNEINTIESKHQIGITKLRNPQFILKALIKEREREREAYSLVHWELFFSFFFLSLFYFHGERWFEERKKKSQQACEPPVSR